MADDKTPEFTNTDLRTIDELAFRLRAADKSAQAINTQLERFITDNYRASQETDKKLSEQNTLLKQQQKTNQTPAAEEAKPIQPINVSKEEDLFTEEPAIEPTASIPETNTTALPAPPPATVTQIVQELPEKSEPAFEVDPEPAKEVKELESSITNVENNTYSVMPTTVEKVEKVIEKNNLSEPQIIESPAQPPQIIEKTIPVVNTVKEIEKSIVSEPSESQSQPTVIEKTVPVNKEPVTPAVKQEAPQIPVTLPPQSAPVVNVNVEETPTSMPAPVVPEVNIPPVAATPPAPVPESSFEPVQPPVNIPEIAAPLPSPVPEFTATTTPPPAEIPSVIAEPEAKKPEMGLNLADESLVGLNRGIEKITAILTQNQSKLIASIDSLNNSVGEILKMLPSLQQQSSEPSARPSQGKNNRIDSSSIISNYRQNLGLTTKSFTSNTVFPGGNSIT